MHEKTTSSVCKTKLQKRGLTAAGKQRWYCKNCKKSSTKIRLDLSKGLLLNRFVDYLLGKLSQSELKASDRTFRKQTKWCWDITPKPIRAGEIHPVLIVDGTKVGKQVCLIIANHKNVIDWHWARYESSASWKEILSLHPEPEMIVCDGQKGVEKATKELWPNIPIQRCFFHIKQNMKSKLTLNPQSEAGQDLLSHFNDIWSVKTSKQADQWINQFRTLYQKHQDYFNQRTINTNPESKRRWWYTHRRIRSAYRQIDKLINQEKLFTYLDQELLNKTKLTKLPRTTNKVEGGINSELKEKLRLHRGMPNEHQKRLTEWYLYQKTEHPKPPRNCL